MEIQRFEFNLFGENTYIIWNRHGGQAAIVDPGMSHREECRVIEQFVVNKDLTLRYCLMTHLHLDHTFGVDFIRETYGSTVVAHRADEMLGQNRALQAQQFHIHGPALGPVVVDEFVQDGHELLLGTERIQVLECPGHSPGSLLFYVPEAKFVITGDAIFAGSIGRTDLPGGDYATLINSIHRKVLTLPATTVIYPGHGPETTVGQELRSNPYI